MDDREAEIRKYAPLMAPILTQMGGGDSDYMYLLSLLDAERARADAAEQAARLMGAYSDLRAIAIELADALWVEYGWIGYEGLHARAREAGLLTYGSTSPCR